MRQILNLRAGELVEVRSKEEILDTLDENGQLEKLPFMPEMLRCCGKLFRVYKRAHKTCDFVTNTGIRRLSNTVHLQNVRCDGSAHGGCQAECLIFWKEAWLKRVPDSTESRGAAISGVAVANESSNPPEGSCSEENLWSRARAPGQELDAPDPTYVCQATLLPQFTRPSSGLDIGNYIEDYRSGNVSNVWQMIPRFFYRGYVNLINLGIGWGHILRWLYDRFQALRGGIPYPGRGGKIPAGQKTPFASLELQVGEQVRVKNFPSILDTVDTNCKNRGMSFSAEMVPYCGGTYSVRSRVNRIIDEKTGKMLKLKNPCILLEGVICQARYSRNLLFCPRATYAYWREIWLERVKEGHRGVNESTTGKTVE
jgi:hypothetical protein